MKRGIRRVGMALSLLAFLGAVGLGVSSHRHGLVAGRAGVRHAVYARSEYGRLFLHYQQTPDAGETPRRVLGTWPLPAGWSSPFIRGWWEHAGFGYGVGGTAGGNAIHQLAIPYWFLMVLFALPPAAGWLGRRRQPPGTCPRCGYDLRATPERCPECGTRVF